MPLRYVDRSVFGAGYVPLEVSGWEPKGFDSVFEGSDTEELLDRFCGWGSDEKIVHRNGNTDLGSAAGFVNRKGSIEDCW